MLRVWLDQHPLAAPYRWVRALRRLPARIRQLESQQREQRNEQTVWIQRTDELFSDHARTFAGHAHALSEHTHVLNEHAHGLAGLAPLHQYPDLPFSHTQPAPDWIANAERVLGRKLSQLSEAEREHWFYSFYSEMAGGVGHILQQQYAVYLPRLPALEGHRVLDIGCGAGEFLDFLRQQGISALGIDLDAQEVARAKSRGLDAIETEALDFLHSCKEQFAAITLLQVIEHVPPAQVRPLIAACVAALAPGGALLVETINLRHPNALNGFYTDPTHQAPLSDNYLSMLAQWYGLERVELLYTLPEWLPGISHEDRPRCYANYTVIGYRKD